MYPLPISVFITKCLIYLPAKVRNFYRFLSMTCVKLSFQPSFLDRTFANNSKSWIYPSQLITDGYVPYLLRYSKKRPRYRPAEMRTRRTKRARWGSPAGGAGLSHQSKRSNPLADILPPFRAKTPTGWRKSSNGVEKILQLGGENPPPRWSDTFNGVQDFILSFPSVFPLP